MLLSLCGNVFCAGFQELEAVSDREEKVEAPSSSEPSPCLLEGDDPLSENSYRR